MQYYVYEHWRSDTGTCFYVGKGKGKRAGRIACRNKHHNNIVAKLTSNGLTVDVRIIKNNMAEQEAFELEIERIKFWRNQNIELANKTNGGEGGSGFSFVMSEEQKKRIREHTQSPEWRLKKSVAMKKISSDPLMKEKRRLAAIKSNSNPETRAKISAALKGIDRGSFTEEHRRKLSEARRGKSRPPMSDEQKQKLSMARRGKPLSKEHRQKYIDAWVRRKAAKIELQELTI